MSTILITIYRPGSQPMSVQFYKFTKFFERLGGCSLPVTITEDLNIYPERATDTDVFTEILASFDLNQFVNNSTNDIGAFWISLWHRRPPAGGYCCGQQWSIRPFICVVDGQLSSTTTHLHYVNSSLLERFKRQITLATATAADWI